MKCILCGSDKFSEVYRLDSAKIVKCKKCGLVATTVGQKESYKSYHRDTDYKKYEKHFRNIFLKRFRVISKYKKKGNVLEIGASTGTMLQIFKENGWEEWGVEPSGSYKIAKKRGIKIMNEPFEKAKLPKEFFDLVILNHTLEHVENPLLVLRKVRKLLKADGICYIDVPNFDSLVSKISGKRFKYLLPHEHLYHFGPKTLRRLLDAAGFKAIYMKASSGVFDVDSIWAHFRNDFALRKKSLLPDLINAPANIITTLLNKGASLSVIAQKR